MRRGVCLPLSSRKQAAKTNLTNGGSEISKTYHGTQVTQGANKYSNVDIVVKFAEFDKFEEN